MAAARKILFVTRTYEYGGAEKHLIQLIETLRAPGVQLSIICLGNDPYTERFGPNSDVRVITSEKMPESLSGWIRLFRSTHSDVVVLIYGWIWALPWTASIGAWFAGVPRRFSIQHLYLPPDANRSPIHNVVRRIFGPLNWKISAGLLHATICVSNNLKDTLVTKLGFPAKRTRVIHNGVSVSEFTPAESAVAELKVKLGFRPDEFIVVCAARLSKQKGIDILLDAIAQLLRSGVRCKCVIVGEGPLKDQLLAQSQKLNLSNDVIFPGFQSDIKPYLSAGSVFALTSHQEGLPLGILEAMACGLPCIVTNVGGNAEAVTQNVNGLVITPDSADAVANAISFLATHPTERAEMSRMARLRACEEFDIKKCMTEISRVILN
jgi:glycosyltransferase involved in cell wall biosynthesis